MTVLVVVCALLLTSLIVSLVLGAFIRAGSEPLIVLSPACRWCWQRGWHEEDCRLWEEASMEGQR